MAMTRERPLLIGNGELRVLSGGQDLEVRKKLRKWGVEREGMQASYRGYYLSSVKAEEFYLILVSKMHWVKYSYFNAF